MIGKTHLALGLAIGMFFIPHVTHKILFLPIILIASILPDIDSAHSKLGHHWYFRPLQWISKHRGMIHSFTFCVLIAAVLSLFTPSLALPFFLGYFGHLFADSFTVEGIRAFWPFGEEVNGKLRTGGAVENGIFIGLIFVILALFLSWFL